jgi:hypothetical protein
MDDYIKKYAKKHKISILKAKQLLRKSSSFVRLTPSVEAPDISLRNIRGQLYAYKGHKLLQNSRVRQVAQDKYYVYVNGEVLKYGNQPLLVSYQDDVRPVPQEVIDATEEYELPGLERPAERPVQLVERPAQPTSSLLAQDKQIAQELLQAYQQLEGRPFQASRQNESKKIIAVKLLNAYYNLSANPATVDSVDMQNLMQAMQRSYFNLSSSPATKRRLDEAIQTITQTASPETQDQLIYELQQSYFTPST